MASHPAVELIKVTKLFPPDVHALNGVSLTIGRGEMVFLTGPSGAGKTTLLRLISRMESPTAGVVEVGGRDLATLKRREIPGFRERMGIVHQDFRLLDQASAFANVAMALEVSYTPPRVIARKVGEILDALGLDDKLETPVANLSRGEQQRVAIGRAMVHEPAVLLADEPTGNLDAAMGAQVIRLFERLNAAGTTIVFASHDEDIYRHTHRRVLSLDKGRLVLTNEPLCPDRSQRCRLS
ncbi:MAG: cell division ATP-binding protein FtsE [Thermodesulfobacteriota bacterium]